MASAPPTRIVSSQALTIEKAGATSLILTANDQPVPGFVIGQEVDVNGTVPNFAGLVSHIKTNVDITRNGTDEVRVYTTVVTLT